MARVGAVLRSLRVPLTLATLVAAVSTTYVVFASVLVQRQLDADGVPGCLDPNVCYPHGAAMDAVFGMELNAAITPALIGVILGVGLFRRASALGVALSAGVVLTGMVATVHRLVGARYTVLANDTYEGVQLLHLNHPMFMIMVTLVVAALGARLGRTPGPTRGRWPIVLVVTYLVVGLAGVLAWQVAAPTGSYAADIGLADGVGYVASALLAGFLAALIATTRGGTTPAVPAPA
ncbi:hypothetical protein [Cryptosporangium sp. NPDC048952]|uniref:hypothetical protein n=1 Tax=Cryptosporangium sp. NPDC048952 TaxID=3363961 RepID=UPI0037167B9F